MDYIYIIRTLIIAILNISRYTSLKNDNHLSTDTSTHIEATISFPVTFFVLVAVMLLQRLCCSDDVIVSVIFLLRGYYCYCKDVVAGCCVLSLLLRYCCCSIIVVVLMVITAVIKKVAKMVKNSCAVHPWTTRQQQHWTNQDFSFRFNHLIINDWMQEAGFVGDVDNNLSLSVGMSDDATIILTRAPISNSGAGFVQVLRVT